MKQIINGFSLLELMLTLTLFSVLLAIAIPQYRHRIVTEEVKNAVSEVEGLILHAKSRAVLTGKPLWIDVYPSVSRQVSSGWHVILHRQKQFGASDILQDVSSAYYPDVVLVSGIFSDQLKIDHQSGRPGKNGHLDFFSRDSSQQVVRLLISYGAGRIRCCTPGESYYGYPVC